MLLRSGNYPEYIQNTLFRLLCEIISKTEHFQISCLIDMDAVCTNALGENVGNAVGNHFMEIFKQNCGYSVLCLCEIISVIIFIWQK